jgi:hypothetical protein
MNQFWLKTWLDTEIWKFKTAGFWKRVYFSNSEQNSQKSHKKIKKSKSGSHFQIMPLLPSRCLCHKNTRTLSHCVRSPAHFLPLDTQTCSQLTTSFLPPLCSQTQSACLHSVSLYRSPVSSSNKPNYPRETTLFLHLCLLMEKPSI